MDESIAESELRASRDESKSRLKSLRIILSTLIKTMPRNELIEVLKKKKIVRYEYLEDKDELVLVEIKKDTVSQLDNNSRGNNNDRIR